jgi:ABC-2 type transport system permease protein
MPSDIRAMVMKDLRVFVRDPMQWSQVLIFFGLLALYFVNLRSFRYNALPDNWRNTIAFLNVFSVSAVMCSLSSRFVYPQLSLEGQGFWIIGLSPVTMRRVLLTKFFLSLAGMLVVSIGLMLISCGMLKAAPLTTTMALLVACAMSFAVSGLSTGLGTIFLDLDQRNPVAIVSGFGGTLNLVLSLAFMLGAILPFALVFHFFTIHRFGTRLLMRYLLMSGSWLLLITVAATAIPLWLGVRSLTRREF